MLDPGCEREAELFMVAMTVFLGKEIQFSGKYRQ